MDKQIEDIIRLMDGATTEGEAQAAAAALQRKLLKENLTLEEARKNMADGEVLATEVIIKGVRLAEPGERGLTWKIYLITAVARFNFCKCLRVGKHGGDVYLVGTELNIAHVRQTFEHLVPVFERIAVDSWENYSRNVQKVGRAKYVNSFLMGVPSGLNDKYFADRQDQYSTMTGVRDLVAVRDREVDDKIASTWGKLGSAGRDHIADYNAYSNGRDVGKSYDGSRPLDSDARRALNG